MANARLMAKCPSAHPKSYKPLGQPQITTSLTKKKESSVNSKREEDLLVNAYSVQAFGLSIERLCGGTALFIT